MTEVDMVSANDAGRWVDESWYLPWGNIHILLSAVDAKLSEAGRLGSFVNCPYMVRSVISMCSMVMVK